MYWNIETKLPTLHIGFPCIFTKFGGRKVIFTENVAFVCRLQAEVWRFCIATKKGQKKNQVCNFHSFQKFNTFVVSTNIQIAAGSEFFFKVLARCEIECHCTISPKLFYNSWQVTQECQETLQTSRIPKSRRKEKNLQISKMVLFWVLFFSHKMNFSFPIKM